MILCVSLLGLLLVVPAQAETASLEHLLRSQVFSKEFEGFDSYYVTIEADDVQPDGSREVLASASGTFLDRVQRLKVLFLLVDDRVVGGQVLEKEGIPPCRSSSMANRPS
ncbi:hypothetical protein [Nitrospira sp. Nam74]